jgi:ABC-type Na+ efflux pump permease subunit
MNGVLQIAALELRVLRRNYKVLCTHLVGLGIILLLLVPQVRTRPAADLPGMLAVILLMAAGGAPLSVGVHALIAEKDRGTLEAMLLLPIRKISLILGKALVTLAMSMVEMLIVAGALAVAARSVPALLSAMASPLVLMVMLAIAPLLALLLTIVAITVSGTSADAQTASNVTVVVGAPIFVIAIGLWFGFVSLHPRLLGMLVVVLAASCAVALRVSAAWLTDERLVERRH